MRLSHSRKLASAYPREEPYTNLAGNDFARRWIGSSTRTRCGRGPWRRSQTWTRCERTFRAALGAFRPGPRVSCGGFGWWRRLNALIFHNTGGASIHISRKTCFDKAARTRVTSRQTLPCRPARLWRQRVTDFVLTKAAANARARPGAMPSVWPRCPRRIISIPTSVTSVDASGARGRGFFEYPGGRRLREHGSAPNVRSGTRAARATEGHRAWASPRQRPFWAAWSWRCKLGGGRAAAEPRAPAAAPADAAGGATRRWALVVSLLFWLLWAHLHSRAHCCFLDSLPDVGSTRFEWSFSVGCGFVLWHRSYTPSLRESAAVVASIRSSSSCACFVKAEDAEASSPGNIALHFRQGR